jgi:hypothetical protein
MMAVVTIFWLVFLPRLSQVDCFKHFIEGNQLRGINPSAVFYSEHPSAQRWEQSIQLRVDQNAQLFWGP